MIKINNISKSWKEKVVLDDITFTIPAGVIYHIQGANGCGKSTLFKIICNIMEATNGTIEKDSNCEIGALIENPGFMEEKTLKQNLKFLASLKKNYQEKKIESLCNRYGLDYYDKLKMKNYSLGMRQKAGIIQAFMENQTIIFLDEPTRGLDKESLKQFYSHIEESKKNNISVVIASHDPLDEIAFDSRFILEEGKLFPIES